jgi:glycosyltransferase involved in cell wall biosynthesis
MIHRLILEIRKVILKIKRYILSLLYKNTVLDEEIDSAWLETKWGYKEPNIIDKIHLPSDVCFDVSFVIPLYNSVVFLPNCMDSLLKQKTDYKYEIILVDDGSKDSTFNMASKYQNSYPDIIKLIHQENAGISSARNTGLRAAKGRYVGFIDHDDTVAPTYVQKLIGAAEENDADIVKCAFQDIRKGVKLGKSQTKNVIIKGEMREELFQYSGFIWGGVYKRELLKNVRFPQGYWYEDMITRALLYRQSKCFVNVGDPLYYKLSHTGNASKIIWSKSNYKCLDQFYLLKGIVEANDILHLEEDVYFYRTILRECETVMVSRTKGLDEITKKQLFLSVRNMLINYYRKEYRSKLAKNDVLWNNAILNKKYMLWKSLGLC